LIACAQGATAQDREGRPLGPVEVRPSEAGDSPVRSTGSTGQTLVALCFVLGMVTVAAAVLKRATRVSGGLIGALGAGGRAPSGVVSVLGRYPVARSATLVLLKVDRRVLVICQSRVSGGITMSTLSEITDAEEVASILLKTRDEEEAQRADRFQEILAASERASTSGSLAEERAGMLQSIRRRVGALSGGAT
jgi:flagellar biogenesis protein FliO